MGRVTVSTAGHAYFTLKDARAQLQCVWFRDERVRSPFQPQTGLQVVAHGRMDLFEPQGALQLYVESLQPSGFGNLAVRFEETKARLAAEGLFDAARKRPAAGAPADDRGRHLAHGRGVAGRLQRPRPAMAAGPRGPRGLPGPGRGRPGEHRRGAAARWSGGSRRRTPRAPGRGRRGRRGRRSSGRHDRRPRRRIAGGSLVVQRRTCRPRDRGPPGAGGLRRGARDGRHPGGLRSGRAGAHAVGRRRAGGAGSRRGRCDRSGRSAAVVARPPRGVSPPPDAMSTRSGARWTARSHGPSWPACGNGRACCWIGPRGPSRNGSRSTAGVWRRCRRGRRGSSSPGWAQPPPAWRRSPRRWRRWDRRRRSRGATRSSVPRADGSILRDPAEAPAGTPLLLALAEGTLAATSDGPVPGAKARR